MCLMDDILIFGKDETEHEERLMKALQRIYSAGITLNQNKCEFKQKQLKFLRHLIDENGISNRGNDHPRISLIFATLWE